MIIVVSSSLRVVFQIIKLGNKLSSLTDYLPHYCSQISGVYITIAPGAEIVGERILG